MIPGMSEDLPARRFGWSDMFVHPDDDPRTDGGFKGERATLVGFLRDQRLTLELKCAGLDAADLARRSVEPSNLSLLGLVRHMAEVERVWFRRRLAGQDAPPHDAGARRRLRGRGARPRGGRPGVGQLAGRGRVRGAVRGRGAQISTSSARRATCLREVLVHMIEEYARHNGHADFLRERIDGRVGQ